MDVVLANMPQLFISSLAGDAFRLMGLDPGVQPIFRTDGAGLSVGLAFKEGDHTHLVRETIPGTTTSDYIKAVCVRLAGLLQDSRGRLAVPPPKIVRSFRDSLIVATTLAVLFGLTAGFVVMLVPIPVVSSLAFLTVFGPIAWLAHRS